MAEKLIQSWIQSAIPVVWEARDSRPEHVEIGWENRPNSLGIREVNKVAMGVKDNSELLHKLLNLVYSSNTIQEFVEETVITYSRELKPSEVGIGLLIATFIQYDFTRHNRKNLKLGWNPFYRLTGMPSVNVARKLIK